MLKQSMNSRTESTLTPSSSSSSSSSTSLPPPLVQLVKPKDQCTTVEEALKAMQESGLVDMTQCATTHHHQDATPRDITSVTNTAEQ